MTESNPTRCGLGLPPEVVLPALSSEQNLRYEANAMGPVAVREAIATAYYGCRGVAVEPAQMFLTASTSEAYSFLFRLLCDPGDEVLVPQPSYPLFDLLARMCDVELRTYPLRWHEFWETDLHAVEASITARTRAIIVVHPNNPTGHFASERERGALDRIAAAHRLPLLVDEVFLDYALQEEPAPESFTADARHDALTFVMSGLSKVLALPQMKLAWTVVLGPEALRNEALHRLEFIADTYLSVAAPAANAAGRWLNHASALHEQVRERVRANLATLDDLLAAHSLASRLEVQGGWSVLLRVPAIEPDTQTAMRVLSQGKVLVYPGSFFGLGSAGWLVLSLLPQPAQFQDAVLRLLRVVELGTRNH